MPCTPVSNSIVVYLRLLTSAQMRLDPDAYAPFLFHPELGEPMDTREFCETFVEAVGKEAGASPSPPSLLFSFFCHAYTTSPFPQTTCR